MIACSAFADTRRKDEVQGLWTDSSINLAPEQFKNAENCCYNYVFELFSRHDIFSQDTIIKSPEIFGTAQIT